MLVAAGVVSEAQLREALAYQLNGGLRLGEALLKLGYVDETTLTRHLARRLGMPFVDLTKDRVPESILARIPAEFAKEQGLLPIADKGGKLIVAIDDQLKRIVVDQLAFMIGGE